MKLILVMAATADGMIARDSRELIDWTGKADKAYFVSQTKKAGVMIMGSTTFDTIGRALPGRKSIVMTRDKTRKSDSPDLVFTDAGPEEILEDLESQGYDTAALIGGSLINGIFMEKDLIDEVHLTMVPRFFGKGLPLFGRPVDAGLSLKEVRQMPDGGVILIYQVQHNGSPEG